MGETLGFSNAVTNEDAGRLWPNLGGKLGLTGAVTKLCALLPWSDSVEAVFCRGRSRGLAGLLGD